MVVFALLLLAATALAMLPLLRGRFFEPVLVWCLGFAALRSARHIPLLTVAAAPLIAAELADIWRRAASRRPPRDAVRIFWELGLELGRSRGPGLWAPALAAAFLALALPLSHLSDFPASRFPVAALANNRERLAPDSSMPRILTSDQWADYLLFQLYPRQRVFFDGRSDFYGPRIGADYQELLAAAPKWRQALARYRFDLALLPRDWPLAAVLENEPGWQRIYGDQNAVLYRKSTSELKQPASGADLTGSGWNP